MASNLERTTWRKLWKPCQWHYWEVKQITKSYTGPIVGGLVNKYGCRPVCMAGRSLFILVFLIEYKIHILEIFPFQCDHLRCLQPFHIQHKCSNIDGKLVTNFTTLWSTLLRRSTTNWLVTMIDILRCSMESWVASVLAWSICQPLLLSATTLTQREL